MKNLIEKLFKRASPNHNYIINEYKPSHGNATSRSARSSEFDLEPFVGKDEMDVDNLYRKG